MLLDLGTRPLRAYVASIAPVLCAAGFITCFLWLGVPIMSALAFSCIPSALLVGAGFRSETRFAASTFMPLFAAVVLFGFLYMSNVWMLLIWVIGSFPLAFCAVLGERKTEKVKASLDVGAMTAFEWILYQGYFAAVLLALWYGAEAHYRPAFVTLAATIGGLFLWYAAASLRRLWKAKRGS